MKEQIMKVIKFNEEEQQKLSKDDRSYYVYAYVMNIGITPTSDKTYLYIGEGKKQRVKQLWRTQLKNEGLLLLIKEKNITINKTIIKVVKSKEEAKNQERIALDLFNPLFNKNFNIGKNVSQFITVAAFQDGEVFEVGESYKHLSINLKKNKNIEMSKSSISRILKRNQNSRTNLVIKSKEDFSERERMIVAFYRNENYKRWIDLLERLD